MPPGIDVGEYKVDIRALGRKLSECSERTERGDILQIVANLGDHQLPMPDLVAGDCLWRGVPAEGGALLPGDITVQLGQL